ncbi:hypothetical protein CHS0354_021033 [Potamilus streckersoni]|uniref:Protein kinase domain-containing protein n=1 Tax=Potamilus streckersoni TaxID=2493646 RepID=A0AAE0VUJ4_9BIVA|nr:hypothetical protein CHS0354_021033 [Potamilus streckersoni]
MGVNHSDRKISFDASGEVNFDHFSILRAIGKGSFGKVCIVQKRDTKKMYAMKYMNKSVCLKMDAVRNVFKEVEILTMLDHPFLVNLWFTFQDEEDMFMVVDLLLGGDLRYHIQQELLFNQDQVRLYICEIALALDYLRGKRIIHRDVKPDNILLDEEGHVHLTDFNIATVLKEGQLATSMSGTKPYMAPEMFACYLDDCPGYSFPVDWWSLGICTYEMLKGWRPFEIHSNTTPDEVKLLLTNTRVHFSSSWNEDLRDLLKQLLCIDPSNRLSTLDALKEHKYIQGIDLDEVVRREIKPIFVPSKEHLNCDPTYELEEMIIEANPLHKKKKRLAKQNSQKRSDSLHTNLNGELEESSMDLIYRNFRTYDREREQKRRLQSTISEPSIAGHKMSPALRKKMLMKANSECQTASNKDENGS